MAKSLDFSKTQRILLFIDLSPLLQIQNPNPNFNSYLKSILISSKYVLSFPSLSSSLFAFKFFFSSLTPLRSSSAIDRLLPNLSSTSLSFNHPAETIDPLCTILNSISTSSISTEFAPSESSATYIASALLQLVHDYSWETQIENPSGTDCDFPFIRSNLVVLFSPICRSLKCISEFLNDDSLRSSDGVCLKFRNLFGAVNDAFVSRDIHLSWIDAKYRIQCDEERVEICQSGPKLGYFEDGIRSLGWSFCSTNSIVLGCAVVPFGLIYPMLGTNFSRLNHAKVHKSIHSQLSLVILDVSGKPLECKCCNLELLSLKILPKLNPNVIMDTLQLRNSESVGFDQDETFCSRFGDGIAKIQVTAVHRYAEGLEIEERASHCFLVRESSSRSEKSRNNCVDDFYAKRVLESLSREMGGFVQRDDVPIWQILMSFLYREGYWALVSISNIDRDSIMGILKPFTSDSALLSVIDNMQIVNKSTGLSPFQTVNSSLGNHGPFDEKRKKNKRQVYEDLSWNSFCKVALECCSSLNLEEVYFGKEFNKSKKLKFLKCWMKQIQSCSDRQLRIQDAADSHKEIYIRLNETQQESEQPISPNHLFEPYRMQTGDAFVSCSETSESFFCNLPKKIQQGLESEGVDLQILAERLVSSSIHWLHQKCEMGNVLESQTQTIKAKDNLIAVELIKLLTKEPKELKGKRKDNGLSSQASDACSISDYVVKEYELQIFLRMEILRSEVGKSTEEFMIQKLVKQICSFLEIIQYLVEGGFHGHLSLYDYVERNIKPRYSRTLANVLDKIYAQMDLLPFGEETESQVLLLNSEDSNQSWRERQERYDTKSLSTEGKSSKSLEENLQEIMREEEQACKLSQARERRERAKRFVSFTSWVPDLQRVWAPKQPKPMRSKSASLNKESKWKERRRASCSVVCETPMTGNKRACVGDYEEQDHGSQNSSSSISKALFQDNHW